MVVDLARGEGESTSNVQVKLQLKGEGVEGRRIGVLHTRLRLQLLQTIVQWAVVKGGLSIKSAGWRRSDPVERCQAARQVGEVAEK